MQFLILTFRRTDRFSHDEFTALAGHEAEQARALYAQEFIRQIWYRGDVEGACMIVEAGSETEVREKLATLPLVEAGMLTVSVIPLAPYAGFRPRGTAAGASAQETTPTRPAGQAR